MNIVTIYYADGSVEVMSGVVAQQVSQTGLCNFVMFTDESIVMNMEVAGIKRITSVPIVDANLDKTPWAFQEWYAKKVAKVEAETKAKELAESPVAE